MKKTSNNNMIDPHPHIYIHTQQHSIKGCMLTHTHDKNTFIKQP